MADRRASSLAEPSEPVRPRPRSSVSRSSHSYGSYDTGELSTATALFRDTSIEGNTSGRSSPHSPRALSPNPHHVEQSIRHRGHDHEAHPRRRSHKPRPSSGFLLSNTIASDRPTAKSKPRDENQRRSRIAVGSRNGGTSLGSSENAGDVPSSTASGSLNTPDSARMRLSKQPDGHDDPNDVRPNSAAATRRPSKIPSLRPNSAPIDVDSTQIVSMALNLSERRLASKRIISSPMPPRLAQLPDTTAGGSLKQHLQQQRKTSRNISPMANRILTPRVVSSPKISSPLHPSLDHETTYTYHFSASTLNRAQKAKEYLELMAQYRRLLLFVSPLKESSRPSTSNPPTSPLSAASPFDMISSAKNRTLGRPYNPLQYIRNRKVRTRERRTIDGEAQGFKDIARVTDWVDEVATVAATMLLTDSSTIPPFPGAEIAPDQHHLSSSIPRPTSTSTKPKRHRFDWSIEPADMLADVNWLEQGDNKYLIEDRNYTRIFAPKPQDHRPATQRNEDINAFPKIGTTDVQRQHDTEDNSTQSTKLDAELPLASTRDRARQKLQDLRGIHHRHNSSIYGPHDFLRFRRGSSSDTSGSESDRHRRGRSGTVSASGRDLMDQQMQHLLAQEAQDEKANQPIGEAGTRMSKPTPSGIVTPDDSSVGEHSRKNSRIDIADLPDKTTFNRPNQSSPLHSGRTSLDVPTHTYRSSIDFDSSRPVSPEAKSGQRYGGIMPTLGMTSSPKGSRPSSPHRHRFSKVKGIFRDHSRERGGPVDDNEEKVISPADSVTAFDVSAIREENELPQRRSTNSPPRSLGTRNTIESHRSHKSMASLKLRPDEQSGLRTLFKGGARLDGMIRGGVNKMSDLIWRKESEEASSSSSDDDSDTGSKRGKARDPDSSPRRSFAAQRPVKNYLDIMPNFKPAALSMDPSQDRETPTSSHIFVHPPSRSPRFDQLKPPRIDIRRASPLSSDNEQESAHHVGSETSEVDLKSRRSAQPSDRLRKTSKELQDVLAMSASSKSGQHMVEPRPLSIPNRTSNLRPTPLSRREIARLRTLVLCTGIKAMEITRRAHEPHPLFALDNKTIGVSWTEMGQFAQDEQANLSAPQTEIFSTTARILSTSIDNSVQKFEASASEFSAETVATVQQRIDKANDGFAVRLMGMARDAFDEADGVNRDIVDSQRLKVKSVVDTMDKMLRRRRRRFRWVRRAGWLAVEWVLVGLMWYVWLVVVITRVFFGMGRGILSFAKWLFWLS